MAKVLMFDNKKRGDESKKLFCLHVFASQKKKKKKNIQWMKEIHQGSKGIIDVHCV